MKEPHFFLREGLVTPVQSTELICTLAFSCTLTQWCLEEEHQSGKPYGSVGTVARNSSGIVMDSEQGPAYFKLRGKKCSVLEDKAIGQLKPCCFTRSEMWLICSYTARNLKEKKIKHPWWTVFCMYLVWRAPCHKKRHSEMYVCKRNWYAYQSYHN